MEELRQNSFRSSLVKEWSGLTGLNPNIVNSQIKHDVWDLPCYEWAEGRARLRAGPKVEELILNWEVVESDINRYLNSFLFFSFQLHNCLRDTWSLPELLRKQWISAHNVKWNLKQIIWLLVGAFRGNDSKPIVMKCVVVKHGKYHSLCFIKDLAQNQHSSERFAG